jgi:hypothetical protein
MRLVVLAAALFTSLQGCARPDPPPPLDPSPSYVEPRGYPWPMVRGSRDPDATTFPDRCRPEAHGPDRELTGCVAP